MVDLAAIVAPIFLSILLGVFLKRILISSDDIWNHINTLTYWILFPSLLFNKTSVIDFEGINIAGYAAVLICGYLAAVLFAYIVGRIGRFNAASLTSILQGGGRHNSFLALAVISQLFGAPGEIIGAMAVAVMVTFSNIFTIIMMTSILSGKDGGKPSILSEVVRNPFIVSIALGLFFNIMGWQQVPILTDFTAYLGKAALPIALICVGAGLHFVGARKFLAPTSIACIAKMIVLPVTVFFGAQFFELSAMVTTSAVVFASVPTSSTAYALAKYMGGDAPLMAAIISLQTLLAVFVIPVAIILSS